MGIPPPLEEKVNRTHCGGVDTNKPISSSPQILLGSNTSTLVVSPLVTFFVIRGHPGEGWNPRQPEDKKTYILLWGLDGYATFATLQ